MSEPRPESQPAQQQEPPGVLGRDGPAGPTTARRATGARASSPARRRSSPAATAASAAPWRIAFAREGADVLISYLNEHEDAQGDRAATSRQAGPHVRAGRPVTSPTGRTAETIIDRGRRGVRPGRRPGQQRRVPDEPRHARRDHRRGVGPHAGDQPLRRCSPVQGRHPAHAAGRVDHQHRRRSTPTARARSSLPYAMTKAGIANFTGGAGPDAGREGHPGQQRRAGADLDAADPRDHAAGEGGELRRAGAAGPAGQPAELAPVYVLLACDEASYVSGARVAVTGGKPIL